MANSASNVTTKNDQPVYEYKQEKKTHEPRQFESFSLEARSSKGFAFPLYNIQYITKPMTPSNDNSNTNKSSDDNNNSSNILSITIIYYRPQRRRVHLCASSRKKIYNVFMYITMYLCRIYLSSVIYRRLRDGYLQ